jgi:hypothetical protein
MTNLLIGFILGIAVCTVGFSGLAKMADAGVSKIQETVRENAK